MRPLRPFGTSAGYLSSSPLHYGREGFGMRRVRHLIALSCTLLTSFVGIGCHHAPHHAASWPSPYGACVQDPPPAFTADDEIMTRKEMRELRKWYRELHHQQKHARHHAPSYDTWGGEAWSGDICPCETDGYTGVPMEYAGAPMEDYPVAGYPIEGFPVEGSVGPWEVVDPGWQPVGQPCPECEASVVVPPPQEGHPVPPTEPMEATPGTSGDQPTISPAPGESTPPVAPAPAEPQPMPRDIEPAAEYLTPPATLPMNVSTRAGALKPTLWVPAAPTN